jgi:putative ABC transport system permease protein
MTTFQNFLFVLRRFKTSSILNITGLSVAFATCIIIMMQIDYDQNFDKSHENSDRIYRVEVANIMKMDEKMSLTSRPFAELLFQSSPHIEAGAITNPWDLEIFVTEEENETSLGYKENLMRFSPSIVNVFKFNMVEGVETALEEPKTVFISQSIARKFFGNEPALGKQLKLQDMQEKIVTIGGVYKDFPANTSMKNGIYATIDKDENVHEWGNFNYNAFVLLDKPGVEKEIIDSFMKNFPGDVADEFKEMTIQFTKLPDVHFITDIQYDFAPKANSSTLAILWAIAIAILLIALINFVNFSMALVPRRIKSINTQKVLGASLVGQRITLISEAVFMNIFAFFLSLFLVHAASSTPVVNLTDAGIDLLLYPKLIAAVFLVSIISGIISGLYPVFYSTSFQPAIVLKGSFGLSAKGQKMRNLLIGIQFTASLVLIISMSFMYLQNQYLYKVPVGYNKDQIIITEVGGKLGSNLEVFKNDLKTFSGIEEIAYSQFILGAKDLNMRWEKNYQGQHVVFHVFPVSPSFLKVMNIQVTEGRDFREGDDDGDSDKYIFNEKTKKEFNLEINTDVENNEEIIGFMPNIQFTTFYQAPTPMAFLVLGKNNKSGQEKQTVYIKVKAGSDMYAAMKHVKKTLSGIDATYPFNVRFYDDIMNQVYQKEQRLGFLITLFSIIAIIISMVGVFGLVVFETQYRRREISIRKVFGSSIEEVMRLFGKTYLLILGICFVIACPIAYFIISRWLEKFAYKIPMYWWVFLLGGVMVSLVTVITVMIQSYKAATANPTKALNSE